MAKRDPAKTQRNKEIARLTDEIKALLPKVLKVTGYPSEFSLNGAYGGKHANYMDIKHVVIDSPEQFVSLYFQGFLATLEGLGIYAQPGNSMFDQYLHIKNNKIVLEWLCLFLSRTYLRKYESLSKVRPSVEEAEIWIGQKNASYGLLVTPRFRAGQWENDKSEIRHFKPRYWTIGHVLETGLVIPDDNDRITFTDVAQYLTFFKSTLVRASGSPHEKAIAKRYCDFVANSDAPLDVPLLIPEFRYGGRAEKHEHRLDFMIVDPYSMAKVGFELSPWSTHGKLTGLAKKTQKQVNEEAQANFEKEMRKLKAYFRKFHITTLVFTDTELQDHDAIFNQISEYLSPTQAPKQLQFQAIEDFLAFVPPV
jgi:hypothetical protein